MDFAKLFKLSWSNQAKRAVESQEAADDAEEFLDSLQVVNESQDAGVQKTQNVENAMYSSEETEAMFAKLRQAEVRYAAAPKIQTGENVMYSTEEIDAMFAKLRQAEVRGMESKEYKQLVQLKKIPDGDGRGDNRGQDDAQPDPDASNGEKNEISYQHFTFENGVAKETICTAYRPERYRLAYDPSPWTQLSNSNVRLAAVCDRVGLMKRKSNYGQGAEIYVGFIKIENKTQVQLSYNVNDYNQEIFIVHRPVGLVGPDETREVLIFTKDTLSLENIKLAHEKFAVYTAPCRIIDLYPNTGTGDQAQAANENKLLVDKITEQHHFDFWRSHKSNWFPQAQIYRINEMYAKKSNWMMYDPKEIKQKSDGQNMEISSATCLEYSHIVFTQKKQDSSSNRHQQILSNWVIYIFIFLVVVILALKFEFWQH